MSDVENLDVLPFITGLRFESAMNNDWEDEYSIKLAVTDTEDYSEGQEALYEKIYTSTLDNEPQNWHRGYYELELGHYDMTKDYYFHLAVKGGA